MAGSERGGERLTGALCAACGAPGAPAELCSTCGAATAIGPPESVLTSSVAVGFLGGGRGAAPAVAVRDGEGGATAITVGGLVRRVAPRQLRSFVDVQGLTSLRSRAAAALLAVERLPVPALTDLAPVRRGVVAATLGDDAVRARRAAWELAVAGAAGPIGDLPLTGTERRWWAAWAAVRTQQFDEAVAAIDELPEDRYLPVVGLLAWCAGSPITSVARRARSQLERRLERLDPSSPLAAAARATGSTSPAVAWLVSRGAGELPIRAPRRAPGDPPSAALDLLRALDGSHDKDAAVRIPVSASGSIVDDLVDGAYRIADGADGAPADPARARYVTARTHPEALGDADVEALGFTAESDRRTLRSGRIPEPTPDRPESPTIAAIRQLVVHHRATDELRTQAGPVVDALAAFLAAPRVEHLTDVVTADESTWGLLENRLEDEALLAEPPRGSPTRRFLAWWALRRTRRWLYEAEWHEALRTAEHALRLAETDAARAEALNMRACAEWQLRRDDAARRALEAAIAVNPGPALSLNLSIVAPDARAARVPGGG